jgi:hypothetical protein
MSNNNDRECDSEDITFVGAENPDGSLPFTRHRGDHTIENGVIHPLIEGQPILGEVVSLTPREDGQGYNTETLYSPDKSGPCMYNSQGFQNGWDATFGNKDKSKLN